MNDINKGERQEDFTGALVKSGETSSSAVAAKAKAEVEAAYLVAIHRPRSVSQSRIDMLEACKRPRFAEIALYTKPVGDGKTVTDFSIRAVETFVQSWGNVRVTQDVVFEDDDIRVIKIGLVDLERNIAYENTVTVKKIVERKNNKGRDVVGERTNSYGSKVYIVKATEDEMANKVGSLISKSIRNHGLRIIPRDILDEARDIVNSTIESGGQDPDTNIKRLTDAFAGIGVEPLDLEKYLGHTIKKIQPAEITELRGIFQAIKDGEAKWADYVDGPPKAERGTLNPENLKPGNPEDHVDVAAAPGKSEGQSIIPDDESAEYRLEEIASSVLPEDLVADNSRWLVCRTLILKALKVKSPTEVTEEAWAMLPTFLKSAAFQKELVSENLIPRKRG